MRLIEISVNFGISNTFDAPPDSLFWLLDRHIFRNTAALLFSYFILLFSVTTNPSVTDLWKTVVPFSFMFWRTSVSCLLHHVECALIYCTFSQMRVLQTYLLYSKRPTHQPVVRIAIPQDRYSAVFGAGGEFEGKEISYFFTTKWFMPRLLSGSFPHPPLQRSFPLTSPHNGNYFKHWLINTEWLDSLFCNPDGCSLKFSLSQLPPQSPLQSSRWISTPRMQPHCLLSVR